MQTNYPLLTPPQEAASSRMPRIAFVTLLACFILPGLMGRNFWTREELGTFACVLEFLDSFDFFTLLCPSISGAPSPTASPLLVMLGSASALFFSPIASYETGARFCVVLAYGLGCAAIWYSTWHLARRYEAQPVALPFLKKQPIRDYERLMADAALLLAISTYGLFIPMREFTPAVLAFAVGAIYLLAFVWSLSQPVRSVFFTGLAASLGIVSVDLWFGVTLYVTAWILHARVRAFKSPLSYRIFWLTAGFASIVLIWIGLSYLLDADRADTWFSAWLHYQMSLSAHWALQDWFSKNILWFAWPVWAYAIIGLISYRKQWSRTHIRTALYIAAGIFAGGFVFATPAIEIMIAMVPALSVLAAFGVMTNERSAVFLERFSTVVCSLIICLLWAVFIIWRLGWPEVLVSHMNSLTGGAVIHIHGMHLALALIATLAWIGTILWRLGKTHAIIWKGPWLSAVGMTVIAVLLTSLFWRAIDANQSYKPFVKMIRSDFSSFAGPGACYSPLGLSPAQERIFSYWGLNFSNGCQFLLTDLSFLEKKDPSRQLYTPVGRIYTRPDENRTYLFVVPNAQKH